MKRKCLIIILAAMMLLSSLTGCSSKQITVCYSVYPVEYILERIADNRIKLCKLSTEEPIQVAHMTEGYQDMIDSAALILQMGELEPYWGIYDSEIRETEATIIDLTTLAAIYDFKRYTIGTVNGNEVVVESEYYEGTAFQKTDMYSKDPNLWLDPIAMTSMAKTIKDWLVDNYPEEAAFFENNFKSLEADLVRLDAEYSELYDGDPIKLVTVLPSFGNWQKTYNIAVYPLILSRYGAMPTEEQITVIKQRIKDDGVKYIVKEANLTEEMQELYDRIKKECNLKEVELSNLSTLTEKEKENNKDYLTIMYDNLMALEKLK